VRAQKLDRVAALGGGHQRLALALDVAHVQQPLDRVGPLVLTAQALNIHTTTTAFACALYFWSRLAHVAIYTAGIPVLRTVSFAGGWIAQAILVLAIFNMM
jgi:uncharacterized MAPEG superfamily protein